MIRVKRTGRRAVGCISETLETRTLFNAGVIDPNFSFPSGGGDLSNVAVLAADGNGKILYGGAPLNGGEVGLFRLRPNGAVDTSFGSGGKLQLSFIPSTHAAVITGVAVQSDGKIIVAGLDGTIDGYYRGPGYSSQRPFIARLTSAGKLDTTFGTGGQITAAFSGIEDVTVLSSGKILYGGDSGFQATGGTRFDAARLNANGSVDTTYGAKGVATANTGQAIRAQNVDFEADGKVIVFGGYETNGGVLVRFNAAGQPDLTFGSGGKVAIPTGVRLLNSAVQTDNKLLVAYANANGTNTLERLNLNGTPDSSFGVAGKAATPFNLYSGAAMAEQSNGNIILAGGSSDALATARFLSNGSLDKNFGVNGVTSTARFNGSNYSADRLLLQSSGRIVVGGQQDTDDPINPPALTRFLGDHVYLTGGTSAVTTGTTNVADPRLVGTVAATQTLNFNYGSGASAVHGQVQEWVEKESASGTLDFYYRIVTSAGSAAGISSLLASNFYSFLSYVDYRPDSNGTIAPVTASRSSDHKSLTFNFLSPADGNGLVTAGTSSYALFIKTDATHYNTLGKVVLNNAITLGGYEPIG